MTTLTMAGLRTVMDGIARRVLLADLTQAVRLHMVQRMRDEGWEYYVIASPTPYLDTDTSRCHVARHPGSGACVLVAVTQ